MVTGVKLSQIASGGAINPSRDVLAGVRSGDTDVLLTPTTIVAGSGIYIQISGSTITISTSPFASAPAVFFFQNDNNAYPADLYGTTYLANFSLIT